MFFVFPPRQTNAEAATRRTASEVAGARGRSAKPLGFADRCDNYGRQGDYKRPLTARQWRRLTKQLNRAEARQGRRLTEQLARAEASSA